MQSFYISSSSPRSISNGQLLHQERRRARRRRGQGEHVVSRQAAARPGVPGGARRREGDARVPRVHAGGVLEREPRVLPGTRVWTHTCGRSAPIPRPRAALWPGSRPGRSACAYWPDPAVVWPPGQRARELLLLLAGASVLKGLLAQAVRGFKERCKADGNPAHAEGERRRSGSQEWASSPVLGSGSGLGGGSTLGGGSGPWSLARVRHALESLGWRGAVGYALERGDGGRCGLRQPRERAADPPPPTHTRIPPGEERQTASSSST